METNEEMKSEIRKAQLISILNSGYEMLIGYPDSNDKECFDLYYHDGKRFDFNNLNFSDEKRKNENWDEIYNHIFDTKIVDEKGNSMQAITADKEFLLKLYELVPKAFLYIADKKTAMKLSNGDIFDITKQK